MFTKVLVVGTWNENQVQYTNISSILKTFIYYMMEIFETSTNSFWKNQVQNYISFVLRGPLLTIKVFVTRELSCCLTVGDKPTWVAQLNIPFQPPVLP